MATAPDGRHPNRVIVKIADDHWGVSCRRCGGKRHRKHRATFAECNEWYVEHSATDFHREFKKRDENEKVAAFMRLIHGDD